MSDNLSSSSSQGSSCRKIPVFETVKASFKETYENPARFARLLALPIFAYFLYFAPYFQNYREFVIKMILDPKLMLLHIVVSIVCSLVVIHNFMDFHLNGKEHFLKVDMSWLRLFARGVFLFWLMYTLYLIGGFACGYAAVSLGKVPEGGFSPSAVGWCTGLLSLFVLPFMARLTMIAPASLQGVNLSMHDSFRLTKGNTLRLFALYLIFALPAALVGFLVNRSEVVDRPFVLAVIMFVSFCYIPVLYVFMTKKYKFFMENADVDSSEKTFEKIPVFRTAKESYLAAFSSPKGILKAAGLWIVLGVLTETLPFIEMKWAGALHFVLSVFFLTAVMVASASYVLNKGIAPLNKSFFLSVGRGFWAAVLALVPTIACFFGGLIVFLYVLSFHMPLQQAVAYFAFFVQNPAAFATTLPDAFTVMVVVMVTVVAVWYFGWLLYDARYIPYYVSALTDKRLDVAGGHRRTKKNVLRLLALTILVALPYGVILHWAAVASGEGLAIALRCLAYIAILPVGTMTARAYLFLTKEGA